MKIINSTLFAITIGLLLTACAQQTELIPTRGQSAERYNQDRSACIKESNTYYGNSGGNPSESDVFLECMKAKGYQIKQKFE
jgi:outer membrane biogenesis lipoprotein LolB